MYAGRTFTPSSMKRRSPDVQTQWQYTKVQALVETKDYIILILGKNQAQPMISAAWRAEAYVSFAGFLSRKTGLHVQTFLR